MRRERGVKERERERGREMEDPCYSPHRGRGIHRRVNLRGGGGVNMDGVEPPIRRQSWIWRIILLNACEDHDKDMDAWPMSR